MPKIDTGKGKLYKVTADGNEYVGEAFIKRGVYKAGLAPNMAYILKIKD